MEATSVLIVGGGPSGLVLGLALSKLNVQSVILEKECGVTEDPRGVFLAADAVRILSALGLGNHFPHIGHEVDQALFHKSSICNSPFFTVPFNQNVLSQAVPDAILQSQPKLEQMLRNQIKESNSCELRESCEVIGRDEHVDHVLVQYRDGFGDGRVIKCSWLVGADGKRGVVRKHFLEPTAGIKQKTGKYPYEGTWIVSNLKVNVPTPETHPNFPLWHFGLTPSQVYDLFWPKGWHFCTVPGYPTACGRFGPHSDRIWRHEIALQSEHLADDPQRIMLKHVASMLRRDMDEAGNNLSQPLTFVQKCVDKWFHNRTILIGDAAHVFPPFGGQGIACGMKDAFTLAWRLALLTRLKNISKPRASKILDLWALERKRGVEDCVMTTMLSGNICNSTEPWSWFVLRRMSTILSWLPPLRTTSQLLTIFVDKGGYQSPRVGFHLSMLNGGFKVAQILTRTPTSATVLSDQLLLNGTSIITVLIIGQSSVSNEQKVKESIHRVRIDPSIVSENSIRTIDLVTGRTAITEKPGSIAIPSSTSLGSEDLRQVVPLTDHDRDLYLSRIGRATAYAIIRPDFVVFATAKSIPELERHLHILNQQLQ